MYIKSHNQNIVRSYFKVFGLFTVLSLVLFWPIFLGKVNLNGNLLVSFWPPYGQNLPFKNTGWDQLRIYFPYYKFTFDEYASGRVPLWSPHSFGGHLHAAGFQAAVFYPLNIFGLLLPQIEFWHLLRITPQIFGAFFMYLFLRNRKLGNLAAVFGALTFGFSPFVLTWGEEVVMSPHTIVFLPLMLFAIDKFLDSTSSKLYLVLFAFSWAFSVLGGYLQTSIYVGIVVFAYLVFIFWTDGKKSYKKYVNILLFWILGTGLAGLQLMPSAELFFNSGRATVNLREQLFGFLLPGKALLTYFAPDFFGNPATLNTFRDKAANYYEAIMFVGVAPLFFSAFAIFKLKTKEIRFWTILGAVTVLSTLDVPTSRLFLSLPIPFLSSSIANRVLFVPAFAISIIGALGFNLWLKGKYKGIFKVVAVFFLIYAFGAFYLLGVRFLGFPYFTGGAGGQSSAAWISLRNLVLPIGVFIVSSTLIILANRFGKKREVLAAILIAVFFAHTYFFAQKYFSFTSRANVFPQTEVFDFLKQNLEHFRFVGLGRGAVPNNIYVQYGLYSPEGYESLNNRAYGEFTFAMEGNKVDDYFTRADAGLGTHGEIEEIFQKPGRRRMMDLLGVKYLVVANEDVEKAAKEGFAVVFGGEKYSVVENLQVIPRAFLASAYQGPPDIYSRDEGLRTKDEILKIEKERRKLIPRKLLGEDFDIRNTLVLEKPSPISPQAGEGRAQIIVYEPQRVVVETSSAVPKILFLSDNYFAGWKAKVDGDETAILRADYTFRALPLTPGEHEVVFYYDPWTFKVGIGTTALSLGILLIYIFRPVQKRIGIPNT